MRFSWDPRKSAANWHSRGFDFAFAAQVFAGRTVEAEDRRRDYGEVRIVAVGRIGGRCYTVVYTDRIDADGPLRWIISARKSNRRETHHYEAA